jgi:hypothetical protein
MSVSWLSAELLKQVQSVSKEEQLFVEKSVSHALQELQHRRDAQHKAAHVHRLLKERGFDLDPKSVYYYSSHDHNKNYDGKTKKGNRKNNHNHKNNEDNHNTTTQLRIGEKIHVCSTQDKTTVILALSEDDDSFFEAVMDVILRALPDHAHWVDSLTEERQEMQAEAVEDDDEDDEDDEEEDDDSFIASSDDQDVKPKKRRRIRDDDDD